MEGLIGIVTSSNAKPVHELDFAPGFFNSKTEVASYKNSMLCVADSSIGYNDQRSVLAICLGELENCSDPETQSNAEIVIKAYERWGHNCFENMLGSFAIIILDKEKDRLLIARDRIGKQILFWYQDENKFIFSTHLKALLGAGVPAHPATDALAAYLYFGYIPQDMTPIQGVNKVLAGHYVQYTLNHVQAIQQYWSYSSLIEREQINPKIFQPKEAEDYLQQAIKKLNPMNQSMGSIFSDGIGSPLTTYYLKKRNPETTIFQAGFEESQKKRASQVAEVLILPLETKVLTQDNFLDDIVEILWHLEEPLADPQVLLTWQLARMASQKNCLLISEVGCDEIFSSENKYSSEGKLEHLKHQFQKKIANISGRLAPWMNYFSRPLAFNLLRKSRNQPWQSDYLRKHAIFNENELKTAAPEIASLFDSKIFLRRFHRLHKIKSPLGSFLYFDLKTRLPDLELTHRERLIKAHGLRWHSPFLDHHLIEYFAGHSIHETQKFLKKKWENIFPKSKDYCFKSTKSNFLGYWLSSEEFEKVLTLLLDGTLVRKGIISQKWLTKVISKPKFQKKYFSKLWAILILEIWYRLFIEQPLTLKAPKISLHELFTKH